MRGGVRGLFVAVTFLAITNGSYQMGNGDGVEIELEERNWWCKKLVHFEAKAVKFS